MTAPDGAADLTADSPPRADDERRLPRARDVAHAALRGGVAAMCMTGMRAVTGGLGIVAETPPQAIARQKFPRLLRRVPRRRRDAVIELFHWGYGAIGGAAYGVIPQRWRRPPWTALAYGLGVWGGFEVALAPTLGIARRRTGLRRERLAIAADHLLYGLLISEIRPAHKAIR